jgi:hypothetical protein
MMLGIPLRVNVFVVFVAVVELIPEPEEKLQSEPVMEYVKVITFPPPSFDCL